MFYQILQAYKGSFSGFKVEAFLLLFGVSLRLKIKSLYKNKMYCCLKCFLFCKSLLILALAITSYYFFAIKKQKIHVHFVQSVYG